MIVSIVVAMSKNNVIGHNNELIWHLPADLKHFKEITTGHYIIMGRKTFESIGKPLPNRTSIVITRNKDYKIEGCIMANSLQDAIEKAAGQDEVFIIGGAEIYRQSMDWVDKIYLTQVDADFEGDAKFPLINFEKWKIISNIANNKDKKNIFNYNFLTLVREL
jgi:dihydrofolate reductase